MSPTLDIPGFTANNPSDMLATLGLLRCWHCQWPEHQVRLSFDPETMGARLHLNQAGEIPDDWPEKLLSAIQAIAPKLTHGEIIKCSVESFQNKLSKVSETALETGWDALPSTMYAAYASELWSEKGEVIASGLSFSNGNSSQWLFTFFHDLCGVITPDLLEHTLSQIGAGYMPKGGKIRRFRWDPSELQVHAHMPTNPEKTVLLTRPALNLFAFFGLSFFPVVQTVKGPETTGLIRKGRRRFLRWPVWDSPIGIDEVTALLATDLDLIPNPVWEAERIVANKNTYFMPAMPAETTASAG